MGLKAKLKIIVGLTHLTAAPLEDAILKMKMTKAVVAVAMHFEISKLLWKQVKQRAFDINDVADVSVGFINVHLNGRQALKG